MTKLFLIVVSLALALTACTGAPGREAGGIFIEGQSGGDAET